MSKLRKQFTSKEWDQCCGSFCKKCEIAKAYDDKFGEKKGMKKLKADKKKMS
ncbi:MAG: hypothetical protein Q8N03_12940 [Ignavibacteria bacterium]|nr:hypothetical protein [Ignavibacteria bacterium]